MGVGSWKLELLYDLGLILSFISGVFFVLSGFGFLKGVWLIKKRRKNKKYLRDC